MRMAHGVMLAPLTTLGVGGPASRVVEVHDRADWPEVAAVVGDSGETPVTLGGGSNVVVADDGCPVPVVHMNTAGITCHRRDHGTVLVTAEAGHSLQQLVDTTVDQGLAGMEMLTGIPGTVGAAPVQNVGAYGQDMADTLVEINAWDWHRRQQVRLPAASCQFGHRVSRFKHSRRWTVLQATFALRRCRLSSPVIYPQVAAILDVAPGTRVPLAEASAAVLATRRTKGMVLEPDNPDLRSAGSVFSSPILDTVTADRLRHDDAPVHLFPDGSTRVSASWLIKKTGFSLGETVTDRVRLSSQHHTLVTEPGATAANFARATRIIIRAVHAATGVHLTPELDGIPHPTWTAPAEPS